MKKNDLIKLLQGIEGNPDLLLWNGTVGDWQDIENNLTSGTLVKETLNHYLEACLKHYRHNTQDPVYKLSDEKVRELTKRYKNVCKWENDPWVAQEDINSRRYSLKKDVLYLEPKSRCETNLDRYGCADLLDKS